MIDFLPFFYKGDNFFDFLFGFMRTKSFLIKGSALKGKNFFLLESTPSSQGRQNVFERETFPKVYHFPLGNKLDQGLHICSFTSSF